MEAVTVKDRFAVSVSTSEISLEPGGKSTVAITILNQGMVVDHFQPKLIGLPSDWVELPQSVQLMPGQHEKVQLTIKPPPSSPIFPGHYPLEVSVSSAVDPSQRVTVHADLTVMSPDPVVESLKQEPGSITMLEASALPDGFLSTQALPRLLFFEGDEVRYTKIQETLKFYRDHLSKEYTTLSQQAKTTYWLWIGCVGLGFFVLVSGLGLSSRGESLRERRPRQA